MRRQYIWNLRNPIIPDKMVALMRKKEVDTSLVGKLGRGARTGDICRSLGNQAKVPKCLQMTVIQATGQACVLVHESYGDRIYLVRSFCFHIGCLLVDYMQEKVRSSVFCGRTWILFSFFSFSALHLPGYVYLEVSKPLMSKQLFSGKLKYYIGNKHGFNRLSTLWILSCAGLESMLEIRVRKEGGTALMVLVKDIY